MRLVKGTAMTRSPAQDTGSARLVPQRYPDKMSRDRAELDAFLDSTILAHVAAVVDGRPVAMPTAFAVIDDALVIHGSTGSRWMRALEGADASVVITRLTGLVVARSMFESSVLYRSAMIFGRFTRVDAARAEAALDHFTERILPGRPGETRPSTRKELAATMFLEMPIRDWSLRISEEMPEDETADIAGDAWAGQILLESPRATAVPAPDLRAGIPIPGSVEHVLRDASGIV